MTEDHQDRIPDHQQVDTKDQRPMEDQRNDIDDQDQMLDHQQVDTSDQSQIQDLQNHKLVHLEE